MIMPISKIKCLGVNIETALYPKKARRFLEAFPNPIGLKHLYDLIDEAWDAILARHNGKLTDEFLSEFYTHPVWSLNAVFAESDPQSRKHREALAVAINDLDIQSTADIGGGNGGFLRILKSAYPTKRCILCEPFIEGGIIEHIHNHGIEWAQAPPSDVDAYILLDVLEHLPNPLEFTKNVIDESRNDSFFFFGNCFWPVIKCHLPSTFFLRRTFPLAAKCMGLAPVGRVQGAEYIEIYRLNKDSTQDLMVEFLNEVLPTISQLAETLML
jgi:hypothetical protein